MKCPHCLVEVYAPSAQIFLGKDSDGQWGILKSECPNHLCGRMILNLVGGVWVERGPYSNFQVEKAHTVYLVRPKGVARAPVPPAVPKEFSEDYREACMVLADSPKASAALSRRCLQHVLREAGKVKKGDLSAEIQQVLDAKALPGHLLESLDAVRNIGNFAAHPIKSKSTGEVVSVEPGEAEWNLDVIEALFDFYFVQPELLKKKRAALDAKLKDAGKPPLK